MQILRSHPDLLNQKLWVWDPEIWILISPPGDSDADYKVWTPNHLTVEVLGQNMKPEKFWLSGEKVHWGRRCASHKLHLAQGSLNLWWSDDFTAEGRVKRRYSWETNKPRSTAGRRVWNVLPHAQADGRGSNLLMELNSMLKLRIWSLSLICWKTFGKVTTSMCR